MARDERRALCEHSRGLVLITSVLEVGCSLGGRSTDGRRRTYRGLEHDSCAASAAAHAFRAPTVAVIRVGRFDRPLSMSASAPRFHMVPLRIRARRRSDEPLLEGAC